MFKVLILIIGLFLFGDHSIACDFLSVPNIISRQSSVRDGGSTKILSHDLILEIKTYCFEGEKKVDIVFTNNGLKSIDYVDSLSPVADSSWPRSSTPSGIRIRLLDGVGRVVSIDDSAMDGYRTNLSLVSKIYTDSKMILSKIMPGDTVIKTYEINSILEGMEPYLKIKNINDYFSQIKVNLRVFFADGVQELIAVESDPF